MSRLVDVIFEKNKQGKPMKYKQTILTATGVLALSSFFTFPAQAVNPYYYSNRDPILITGKVISNSGDVFQLDYGTGAVIVELDDWDSLHNEADKLLNGETVTVSGKIDNDLFEKHSIEAGTVYVHDRNIFYYGSEIDEEGPANLYSYSFNAPEGSLISASGSVKNISGREFTLDTGFGDITVDTDKMIYNPLDDEGFQQIDAGDRVSVSGILDDGFFEGRHIEADNIISLIPGRMAKSDNQQPER